MQLQGIIFDFDGTLADTLPVIFRAFRSSLQKHLGKEYTREELEALFGPTEEGIIKQLVADAWEPCYADYLSEYRQGHPPRPFQDLETALRLLRQRGIRLAIATGKGRGSLMASLEITRLGEYFDILETGSETGAVKPAQIARVIAHWGLAPETVAYLGDTVYDVKAARAAGVVALCAAWSSYADVRKLYDAGPDGIFSSVAEFIDWIDSGRMSCLTEACSD